MGMDSFKQFLLEQVELGDFWDMLNRFDWHFEHSDDHRVWKAGNENYKRLGQIAQQSEEHQNLFLRFSSAINKAEPRPKRPA